MSSRWCDSLHHWNTDCLNFGLECKDKLCLGFRCVFLWPYIGSHNLDSILCQYLVISSFIIKVQLWGYKIRCLKMKNFKGFFDILWNEGEPANFGLIFTKKPFSNLIWNMLRGPSINYFISKWAIFEPFPPLSRLFSK